MQREIEPGTAGLVWDKWHIRLEPNPDWEYIKFKVPGHLLGFHLWTESVIPEPSAFAGLFAITALLISRRRRA